MNVEKTGSISAALLAVIVLVRVALNVVLIRMVRSGLSVSLVSLHMASSLPVLTSMLLLALFGVALALVLRSLWRRLCPNSPALTWLIIGFGAVAAAFHVALGVHAVVSMVSLTALYGVDPSWADKYLRFLRLSTWITSYATAALGAAIFLIGWVGWRDHRLPGWMNILAIAQAFPLIYTLVARYPLFNGLAVMLILHMPWYIGLAIALSRGVNPNDQAMPLREEQP